MSDLTSGVFGNLGITFTMDVYQRLSYRQSILRGAALKKYKTVLLQCKQLAKNLAGDIWTFGNMKELSTDKLWSWDKSDRIGYAGDK